jgi:uncharacterized RDD family membrane protein YckC
MSIIPKEEVRARDILANRPFAKRVPRRIFGRYAGFVSRAIGLVIDQAVIGIVSVTLFLVVRSVLSLAGMQVDSCTAFVPVEDFADVLTNVCRVARGGTYFISVMFGPTYYVVLWMLTGQTIGMAIAGVRVVRADGTNIFLRQSLMRMIGFFLCVLSLGFGFVRVIWDDRRQGWHDKLANSYVVYSWKHVPVPVATQPIMPLPVADDD